MSSSLGSLVRSLAALLSLSHYQATASAEHAEGRDRKVLAALDRLSLFFVKRAGGDVVALSTSIERDRFIAVIAGLLEHEPSDKASTATDSAADVWSDGQVVDSDAVHSSDQSTGPSHTVAPEATIYACYNQKEEHRKGVSNEISDLLAAAPIHLRPFISVSGTPSRSDHLNRVGLQITGRPISETWSHTEFSHYIIFYSVIKIHARLTCTCIPGTNVKLLDVLANIAEDTIVAHNEPLPVHKFDQNSEEMLADEIGIGYEQMTKVSANVAHIGSDAQSQRLVWQYFIASLQHLQLLGSKLVSYRRRPSPNHDQVNPAQENLAKYTELLVILDWPLRCPAVWRVCRNPTVAVAIAKARQDYYLRLVARDGQPEDVLDLEDDLDDLEESVIDMVRNWAKLLVQWTRALDDLHGPSSVRRAVGDRVLSLVEVHGDREAAALHHPPLYSSDLVAVVMSDDRLHADIRNDQSAIMEAILKGVSSKSQEALDVKLKEVFTSHDQVHGESLLACQEHAEKILVGVSERCCYLCSKLLTRRRVEHSRSNGKVYAWIPPRGISESDLQFLATSIKECAVRFVNDNYAPRKTPDSGAASDSSDGGLKYRARVDAARKALVNLPLEACTSTFISTNSCDILPCLVAG